MGIPVHSFDTMTPHPGIKLENNRATCQTNGNWVTLRSMTALNRYSTSTDCTWGVHIIETGESEDLTGIMVGLLPRKINLSDMKSKYIAEMGGWCISRAGESYGTFQLDELIPFHKGDTIEFMLDFNSSIITIICGKKLINITYPKLLEDTYYPAVSMYYYNQSVVFV